MSSALTRLRDLPVLRWSGEFVTIVVGVLVALAVDSYREDQLDEERERVYLAYLHADLTADRQLLEQSIRYSDAALTQTEALMLLVGMDLDGYLLRKEIVEDGYDRSALSERYVLQLPPTASSQSTGNSVNGMTQGANGWIIWAAGVFDLYTPNEATYSTLVSTGDLKIIKDDRLRRLISMYYERTRRNYEDADTLGSDVYALNAYLRETGINPYELEELLGLPDLPKTQAALALARDSHHWWYVRKLGMQGAYDRLMDLLEIEMRARGIEPLQ